MEKLSELEQKWLKEELSEGKELAKQLKYQISPKTSSKETCEHLVQKIVSSYDRALEFLKWTMLVKQGTSPVYDGLLESSPECNDGVSLKRGQAKDQCIKGASKKRKTMVRWSEQVPVNSRKGFEGVLDDGYSWRKYGHKYILGATHPRAYYRCTHRHTRGCKATKHLQRSDEDSSIVEVIYNGNHTCLDASICALSMENERQKHIIKPPREVKQIKEEKDGMFEFGQPPKFENESFPSSVWEEDNILGSYSPGFLSTSTSESSYLTTSPCKMNHYGMSSVKNPPLEVDSPIEMDFDSDVEIDNIEYYFS